MPFKSGTNIGKFDFTISNIFIIFIGKNCSNPTIVNPAESAHPVIRTKTC